MKSRMYCVLTASLLAVAACSSYASRLDDIEDQLDDMEYMNELRQLQETQRQLNKSQRGRSSRPSTWQEIAKGTDGTYYSIDTATIKMIKGNVSFVYDASGNFPRYHNNVVYFGSFITAEINCRARTIKRVSAVLFSKSNQIVGDVNYAATPYSLGSNTVEAAFAKYLCR